MDSGKLYNSFSYSLKISLYRDRKDSGVGHPKAEPCSSDLRCSLNSLRSMPN